MAAIQPYADRHINPRGPGDARPTAEEVVRDQGLVDALTGTTILITGCTSGIGVETARALDLTGANIYMTARSTAKGEAIAKDLAKDPSRPIKVLEMALDSFASIHAAAQAFLARESKLNILILNAGIMGCPQGVTAEGHELHFGTNHLGHFLLFQLLRPALLAAATPDHPSRVIAIASARFRVSQLPLDDLGYSESDYNPSMAYGRSKLANIWFANELDRRYRELGINGLSLHPGMILTELQRHVNGSEQYRKAVNSEAYLKESKSVEQGAATTVWAAIGKELAHRGGIFLQDVGEAGEDNEQDWAAFGLSGAGSINQPDDEKRLWEISNQLCNI